MQDLRSVQLLVVDDELTIPALVNNFENLHILLFFALKDFWMVSLALSMASYV